MTFSAVLAAAAVLAGAGTAVALRSRHRKRQVELLEFHVRQAGKAYARMLDARNDAEAAAAHSDLKNDFTVALALAGRLGLKERAREIEGRLEHCEAAYRGQRRR